MIIAKLFVGSPVICSTKRRTLVILALFGTSASLNFGQSSPDVKGILEGVAKVYANPLRYEVVETITTELAAVSGRALSKSRMRIASQDPNKFRLEMEDSLEIDGLPSDPDHGPMVIIGDGTDIWEIWPAVNQYAKSKPDDLPKIQAWMKAAESGVFDIPMMLRKEVANVTLLRQEPLTLDGNTMDCFVIKANLPNHPESITLWVEKTRFLVRRIRSEQEPSTDTHGVGASITGDFHLVNIGGAPPDITFVFTPSPSATEVGK